MVSSILDGTGTTYHYLTWSLLIKAFGSNVCSIGSQDV